MKKALCFAAAIVASASLAWAGEPAKVTLKVEGMTCGGCVAAVKVQLKKTEGVTAYEVSLEKGEAEVTYDPAKTEPKKIAASVSKTGFAASVKEAGASLRGTPEAREGSPDTRQQATTAQRRERLQPWEPVDLAFLGCSEGVCGLRGRNPEAVARPGARPGQHVYCPVSGAVFRVKDDGPRAEVNGHVLHLCCDACARYFAQNRDRVLAAREMSL
jgi:copper chaperone